MVWYELPNSTDTEGVFEFFGYVNRISDYFFFPVMLLVIWFISFVSVFSTGGQNKEAAARGFTFASFLVSILSIMLAIMGFLAPKYMYLTFVLVGIGALWLKMEN